MVFAACTLGTRLVQQSGASALQARTVCLLTGGAEALILAFAHKLPSSGKRLPGRRIWRAAVQARQGMGAKGRRRQGRAPATTSTTLAAEKRADKFMTGSNEKTSDVTLPPPGWNNEVAFLASHSQPSDKLPGRLAVQLCVAPRPSHPCHPFAVRAHGWTSVRPVTESTPCRALHHSTGGGGGTARHGKGSHSNGSVGDVDRRKPQCFHPALGQKGLFAQRDIPPRTLVVPYMGRAHLTQSDDEDPDSRYDAAIVVDGTRCGIDATHMGSEARCECARLLSSLASRQRLVERRMASAAVLLTLARNPLPLLHSCE